MLEQKELSPEHVAKQQQLTTVPTNEASIEGLPDALLLIIIKYVKKQCSISQFISTVAAFNQRFRRLAMSGHLWKSRDFSSKDTVCWIIKNVDLALVRFNKALRLKKLEHFSPMEIITIFDALGKHVRTLVLHTSDSMFKSHQSLCQDLMIRRCTSLVELEIGQVMMSAFIPCLASLPKLVNLTVYDICSIPATEGIIQLFDALDSNCTGLTSLMLGSETSVLFLEHPLNKISQLKNLCIFDCFALQENFFTHLPPSLTSLKIFSEDQAMASTVWIAGNSSLESLDIKIAPEGLVTVKIEDCSQFRSFRMEGNRIDDFCSTFQSCPNLREVDLGDFEQCEDSVHRIIDCPSITSLHSPKALSVDLYGTLPSLTDLNILYLDDSISWSVTDLLRQLAAPTILQYLRIFGHEFTEQLLEISLPQLQLFTIRAPCRLPHTISMDCPMLKGLFLTTGSENPANKLKCLNLSNCTSLQAVVLGKECVDHDSINRHWIEDLLSRAANNDVRKSFMSKFRSFLI
mmetsp:Transcript_16039/g.26290  ORF Transcript_16039/g.26290 Transcript_16039/m.26290 type:complete len:517 (-) Transcript_16039:237-1787(-)